MTSAVNTGTMRRESSAISRRNNTASRKRRKAVPSGGFLLFVTVAFMALFFVILSAYAAKLQASNNELEKENSCIEAEIDSINNEITDQTTLGKIEKTASGKYGMVYPNAKNYITVKDNKTSNGNLADVIKDEAYN